MIPRVAILAVLAAATSTALAAVPSAARACSCMAQTQPDAFAGAASVFEGRVVTVEGAADPTMDVTVALAIVRRWKGMDAEQVQVVTASNSAACGFELEQGRSYLVYTHGATDEEGNPTEGLERVSLCSRTARIEDAGEDLAAMGEGVTPVDPQGGTEAEEDIANPPAQQGNSQSAGCASCAVGAPRPGAVHGLGGGLLVGLLGVLRRTRRRSRRQVIPRP
jgi:hypothetical protein